MHLTDEIGIFTGHETNVDLDRLESLYGQKKKFAQGYRKQILLALSHYPELASVEIHFVFTESEHPISARPKPMTLFRDGWKRAYEISISTKISASKEPVLLRNLPYALQVLQFAHEFGHVIDYISMSAFEFIGNGLMYGLPAKKRQMEQKADREAVKHGFGKQVMEFSELIYKLQEQFPEEKYYREYHKSYMTPGEARAEMKRHLLYRL